MSFSDAHVEAVPEQSCSRKRRIPEWEVVLPGTRTSFASFGPSRFRSESTENFSVSVPLFP